jgi:hypothetical protein
MYSHFLTNMLPHYPFLIARDLPLTKCRERKPTLFVAILAASAASTGAQDIQHTLLDEVFTMIASKSVCQGDRSLQMLQAIITTVTWYTPPACPEHSRVWMMINYGTAMLLDLNLGDSRPPPAPGNKLFVSGSQKGKDPAEDMEERRALLTIYSCSAYISVILRRPMLLRYGKKIQAAYDVLLSTGEASDKIIIGYVTLARFIEEAATACGLLDSDQPPPTTVSWILESFERRIKESWTHTNSSLMDQAGHTSVTIAHYGAIMQVFSIVFELPVPPPTEMNRFHLHAQTSLISAAHSTISGFLSSPTETLLASPFLAYSRTAHACSILLRLAGKLETPEQLEHLNISYFFPQVVEKLGQLKKARMGSLCLALMEGMWKFYKSKFLGKGEGDDGVGVGEGGGAVSGGEEEEGGGGDEEIEAASILCGGAGTATRSAGGSRRGSGVAGAKEGAGLAAAAAAAAAAGENGNAGATGLGGGGGYAGYQQGMDVSVYGLGVDLSAEEIEQFWQGIDGQIMMGGGGDPWGLPIAIGEAGWSACVPSVWPWPPRGQEVGGFGWG